MSFRSVRATDWIDCRIGDVSLPLAVMTRWKAALTGCSAYRRGLVLGFTVAEVMILLIFVLLMVLAAALANRDKRIEAMDQGGAARLVEQLQRAATAISTRT